MGFELTDDEKREISEASLLEDFNNPDNLLYWTVKKSSRSNTKTEANFYLQLADRLTKLKYLESVIQDQFIKIERPQNLGGNSMVAKDEMQRDHLEVDEE